MGCYGTVAQLGERRTEDAEAAGSSPASPTNIIVLILGLGLSKGFRLNLLKPFQAQLGHVHQGIELLS